MHNCATRLSSPLPGILRGSKKSYSLSYTCNLLKTRRVHLLGGQSIGAPTELGGHNPRL